MPTIQGVRCPGGTTREPTASRRTAPRLVAAAASPATAPHAPRCRPAPIAQAWHEGLAGGWHGEARGEVRGEGPQGGL